VFCSSTLIIYIHYYNQLHSRITSSTFCSSSAAPPPLCSPFIFTSPPHHLLYAPLPIFCITSSVFCSSTLIIHTLL
jgi:hypothetical protein